MRRGAASGPASASFLKLLRAGIEGQNLSGQRILAACSGGPDSLALLVGLHCLREVCGLELWAGTIDHGLREGSARDVVYVRRIAKALDIPCLSRCLTLSPMSGAGGVEAQAREARYAALREMASETGCTAIATAHTLNDQAETLLMRLSAGSGLLGARGILRRSGSVVRPMLDISRQEVLSFLREQRLKGRQDPTNESGRFVRNRIRLSVLPALEAAMGPGTLAALGRFCDIAASDALFLEKAAAQTEQALGIGSSGEPSADALWKTDSAALLSLDSAMRFRILRDGVQRLGGRFGMDLFQRLEAALGQKAPRLIQAEGGVEILIRYGQIEMRRKHAGQVISERPPVQRLDFPELNGTWSACWRDVQIRIRHLLPGESAGVGAVGLDAAELARAVSQDLIRLPLLVRTRRPGDVFRPGGVGTKKLKDFLMDARIPAEARDAVPLLTDSGAEVLYVIGRRESSWLARTAGIQGGWEIAFRHVSSTSEAAGKRPASAIEKGDAED